MKKLFLILPLPLIAQEVLPELVITASRTEERIEDLPYTAQVLSAADLLANASRTLPQAFLNTPGVLVQQTTTAHGSPYIRGFTGRQNLLLQDGIRLNNSTWRGGPVQYWNTLDSQAISQIELIKSQGSVLYGSDAASDTQRIPINGTPGYLVASLYSGWQVTEALSLNLALENLTDKDYRIHGSGQNQAGRNATLSVKYQW